MNNFKFLTKNKTIGIERPLFLNRYQLSVYKNGWDAYIMGVPIEDCTIESFFIAQLWRIGWQHSKKQNENI